MINRIINSFDLCKSNDCIKTENSHFKVYDIVGSRCSICKDEQPDNLSFFSVSNLTGKPIHFLSIDNCIFDHSDGKKCDCAVFDDKKFCFVEIKKCKKRQRSTRRKEAYEQIEKTIIKFMEKDLFEGYTLEAFVCLGNRNGIPKRTSKSIGMSKYFFDKFKAHLNEGNLIEFS